jgi:tetratricopeptide (TPR) repeat protein
MADKNNDVMLEVEEKWSRVEDYIQENKKSLSTIGTIVVVLILAFVAFNWWYLPGQEQDAEAAIVHAQRYFSEDSINKAINGDAGSLGFEAIADQYSMTKAGKLANYYLGLCYYMKKDYNKSLEYLEKFNAKDVLVSPMAAGVMGDDEMQLNQTDKALEYYMTAVKRSDNEYTAPIFLKKAALACEIKGDWAQATTLYETVKTQYHASQQAQDIDKYIARAKAKAGTATTN